MQFKGWTIPGNPVPGSSTPPKVTLLNSVNDENVSCDALSGYFKIFQLQSGHRFSTDDLLVAWYGTAYAPCPLRVLDLGSGIGTVAQVAAFRLPGSFFTTIEAQPVSVELARASVEYNGLSGRFDIREGDFRIQDGSVLCADEKFDLIFGSPPYFPEGTGAQSDHPQKLACRFEMRGTVSDYAMTASKHLSPGGVFAFVFPVRPSEQEKRVQEAVRSAGLRLIRMREVIFKEGDEPLIGLFLAGKTEDFPAVTESKKIYWKEPPLLIRKKDGTISDEYQVLKLSFGFPP